MRRIKTCPTCGSKKIKKVGKKWTGQYQGQAYSVENLEFHECPDCGEKVYDREAMRSIEANHPAFPKAAAPK